MYGAVMGLVGLGLTARSAATVLPGYVRAPAYVTEPWVALGVIAFLVLVPLYVAKLVRYPAAVREEFTNPVQLGFCGALPVGMSLVAGALGPYLPAAANALWWASAAIYFAFFAWGAYRVLSARARIADVYPAWLILFVGGIVFPGSGIGLGQLEASRVIFGISALAALFLYALLVYRAIAGPPLPEQLRPSWFILLVPPSLIGAHGFGLFGEPAFEYLFFPALAVLAGLLAYSLRLLRRQFSAVWWSMTFPLDAFAYAAARYAQNHPLGPWKAIAGFGLALATLAVAAILMRSLFAVPRSAASRGA
jgi:tellurite resistance protein